jgi:alkylation response protein AidB-like acyl-CoA dehydrogenase
MMNYERLSMGIQGLGASEFAYQNAAQYATDRLQGRSASGVQSNTKWGFMVTQLASSTLITRKVS